MTKRLPTRTNDAWVSLLRDGGDPTSVAEMHDYLTRVLAKIIRGRLSDEDIVELVQESFTRIVESLDSFRGDSAFATWATAIATRVAFTELRRRQTQERQYDTFDAVRDEVSRQAADDAVSPDDAASRSDLFQRLRSAIETELTERQRLAVLAELRGLPTIEISERLGTNQNALYKLVHDARKKLRSALIEAGYSAESIAELSAGSGSK